jgi:hypothetical protein
MGLRWLWTDGPEPLSILNEVSGDSGRSTALYRAYCHAVVSRLPEQSWRITVESVRDWIQHETAEMHDMHELDRSLERMIARQEDDPEFDSVA